MKKLIPTLLCPVGLWAAGCSGYGTQIPYTLHGVSGMVVENPIHMVLGPIQITDKRLALSQSTGFDIIFSDPANTTCWTQPYTLSFNSGTGVWIGYVTPPTGVGPGNQPVLLWVGKGSVSNGTLNAQDWAADAVVQQYSLQENCVTIAGDFKDGVGSRNSTGGVCPTRVAGYIGNAQQFVSASGHIIKMVNGISTGGTLSMSALVKTVSGNTLWAFCNRINAPFAGGQIGIDGSANHANTRVKDFPAGNQLFSSTDDSGAWHFLEMTFNSTGTGNLKLYEDGVLLATSTTGSFTSFTTGTANIGSDFNDSAATNGFVQEVRAANTTYSLDAVLVHAYAALNPTLMLVSASKTWGSN